MRIPSTIVSILAVIPLLSRATCSPQADIYLSSPTSLCLSLLPPLSILWQEPHLVFATDPVQTC